MASIETAENQGNEELVTRYYRNDYDEVKVIIEKIVKRNDYTLVHVNDDFGEFLVEDETFTIIIKVMSITPIQTAIDFCVTNKKLFKNCKHVIVAWYKALDESLQFLGKGMNKDG